MARTSLYNFTATQYGIMFSVEGDAPITIQFADLTDDVQHRALVHGLKQKVADAAAIERDPATGRSATPVDKAAAMRAVATRISGGAWNATAGEGAGGAGGLLFRALCQLYPARTSDQITEYMGGLTKPQQAALRANPRVAAVIATLRPVAKPAANSDSLLDALGAMGDDADTMADDAGEMTDDGDIA